MPKFVDDLHVEGAMTAHADPAKTTQTLTAAVGQSVPIAKYFASDGSTVVFSVAVDGTVTATAFSVAGAPVATQAYVATAVANLVNSAPGILDTLGEIATALQADESTAAALATTVAGKIAASLVDAKGDLLVGSADNTIVRKAVGTDGQVLTADAASGGGVKWATPAAGGSSPLLTTVDYTNGSNYTTTSTSVVAIDAANLTFTFTAPASGTVLIGASINTNNAGGNTFLACLTHGGGTTYGLTKVEQGTGWYGRPSYRRKVTGLTPGNSYSLDLAWKVDGGSATIYNDSVMIEVWSA